MFRVPLLSPLRFPRGFFLYFLLFLSAYLLPQVYRTVRATVIVYY
jgi:hypothetical protein